MHFGVAQEATDTHSTLVVDAGSLLNCNALIREQQKLS